MSGASVAKLRPKENNIELIEVTPEMAMQLLDHNQQNRPLRQRHVQRIAGQILEGKWQYNGDTIKIADSGDVLDGQHRLWAIVEAKRAVESIIVRNVPKAAFSTIDTIRATRSGGDTLALLGVTRYRTAAATALTWLLRWQWGVMADWKAPQNKIENSDVEEAWKHHPGILQAVERAANLRGLVNAPLMAFLYYAMSNRNAELAERMMETLENPAGVSVSDPFFRLRSYFTANHHQRKEPLTTIALAFKAANAAHKQLKIQVLNWRNQGKAPEPFPTLEIDNGVKPAKAA